MAEEKGQVNKMSEEKFKRVVIALTVGAVLLLTILLGIMVYQIVSIFSLKRTNAQIEKDIAYVRELIAKNEDEKVITQMKEYIDRVARENGYVLPSDIRI